MIGRALTVFSKKKTYQVELWPGPKHCSLRVQRQQGLLHGGPDYHQTNGQGHRFIIAANEKKLLNIGTICSHQSYQ
jgi:hypothetical protein